MRDVGGAAYQCAGCVDAEGARVCAVEPRGPGEAEKAVFLHHVSSFGARVGCRGIVSVVELAGAVLARLERLAETDA